MWRRDSVPTCPCLQHGTFRFSLKWNQESFFSILSPPWTVQVCSPPAESKFLFILQLCILYGKKSLVWLMLEQWLFSVFLHSPPMVMAILGPSPAPASQLLLFFPRITGPCLFGISRKCRHVVFPVQGHSSRFLLSGFCCEGTHSLL